jgi:hypothetical protein
MKELLALAIILVFSLGPIDAWVLKNQNYEISIDSSFLHNISKGVKFPNRPLGDCIDGTKDLADHFQNEGYNITYAMYQGTWETQGHVWLLVENPAHKGTWLAVDNYLGPMMGNNPKYYTLEYYRPQFSFGNFSQIGDFILRITYEF